METDEIQESFTRFIEGKSLPVKCKEKYGSIFIDYNDIVDHDPKLAYAIVNSPKTCLDTLNLLCKTKLYSNIKVDFITVRFLNLPVMSFRDLTSEYINKLISLKGIIDGVANVKPMATKGCFIHSLCGKPNHKFQFEQYLVYPTSCDKCKKRGGQFTLTDEHTTFIDSQTMSLVERPENLPAGDIPKRADIIILKDLIETVRAGDFVVANGIVRVRQEAQKLKKKVFNIFIEINSVEVENKEITNIEITSKDEVKIKALADDPKIYERMIKSIVPSVYGYEHVKESILYLLFGGVKKELGDISVRGEMNVLLIGDPATSKSQLLRGTARIAPRAIFTSGRGTSAAGLTAAVIKGKDDEWILESGALVLGDKGVVCIDEMDKMNNDDRIAIHEALEQGTISIAKVRHKVTLNARCAVLCAANPAYGRWDKKEKTIAENLGKFPITLLSRMDLIFILRDIPTPEGDARMAEHILKLRKNDKKINGVIPTLLLQKYIGYAKRINPIMTDEAVNTLKDYYVRLRQVQQANHPIAITARQLESLARISEAHARIQLREIVKVEDVTAATNLMNISCKDVSIPIKEGEKIGPQENDNIIAKGILEQHLNNHGKGPSKDEFIQGMIRANIPQKRARQTFKRLRENIIITLHEVDDYRLSGK